MASLHSVMYLNMVQGGSKLASACTSILHLAMPTSPLSIKSLAFSLLPLGPCEGCSFSLEFLSLAPSPNFPSRMQFEKLFLRVPLHSFCTLHL
jgi:hypothetical protein